MEVGFEVWATGEKEMKLCAINKMIGYLIKSFILFLKVVKHGSA